MKNNFRKDEDFMFEEEVSEDMLYDKKNQSDIVYVESSEHIIRTRVLIVLAVILIILAIISSFFGFVYLGKDQQDNKETTTSVTRYDIFVSHSNASYGGSIDSFAKYNSLDNAFNYDFKVSNENPVDIDYKIEVIDNNYDKNSKYLPMISYSLFNNDVQITEGVFDSKEINVIEKVTIKANSSDSLRLKIWSTEIENNIGFNFKVNVAV